MSSLRFLNIHFGLQTFVTNTVDIFGPVFLYKMGIEIYLIFLIYGGTFLLRSAFRIFALKSCEKYGMRTNLIIGTVARGGLAFSLLMMNQSHSWIYVFMVMTVIVDVFYWTAYHTYFAAIGNIERRGKELGTRKIFQNTATILAPIASGIIVAQFNFWYLFAILIVFALLSAVPLLYIDDYKPKRKLTLRQAIKKVDKTGMFLSFANAPIVSGFELPFSLFAFITVKNYISFGGLFSSIFVIEAILFYTTCSFVDLKKFKNLYFFGATLMSIAIVNHVLFSKTATTILLFEVAYILSNALLSPRIFSTRYNASKKSENALWFTYFLEFGWDMGSLLTCLVASLMIYSSFDFRYTMLLGIIGIIGTTFVIRNHDKKQLAVSLLAVNEIS